MERDPTPWLDFRAVADLILWAAVIAVFLLYIWSLTVGPVSRADPAPHIAPEPALKPVSPLGRTLALV